VPKPLKNGNFGFRSINGYEASLVPRWFLITVLISRFDRAYRLC